MTKHLRSQAIQAMHVGNVGIEGILSKYNTFSKISVTLM
jgi:hypothetical protein